MSPSPARGAAAPGPRSFRSSFVGLVAAPPLAHAAASWQSGPLVEVQDSNCITGQIEYEAGTYLSYFADPANPPQVGQVYYVALDIAGIGDTCSGAYGSFELSMPSGTAPAISAANPVRCYLKPRSSNTYTNVAGNCPQSLQVGPHGYYLNPTNTNPPFWPVVQGDAVEVQVPVVSSAPLNGTDQFHAFVQLADGETDPFMAPSLLAIVNPSGSQNVSGTNKQIGIVYANPTITGQTTNGNSTVNANFLGYVENNSNPGTAYAELAKADAAGDCTSPVLFNPTIKSNVVFAPESPDPDHGHLDDALPRRRVLLPHRRDGQLRPAGRNVLRQLAVLRHPGRVPQQCRHEPVRPAGRASDHGNRLLERRGVRHLELRHRILLQPDGLGVRRGARAHGHARRHRLRGASPTARRSRARARARRRTRRAPTPSR